MIYIIIENIENIENVESIENNINIQILILSPHKFHDHTGHKYIEKIEFSPK